MIKADQLIFSKDHERQYVSNYIDQGHPVDVIYLEFQKAFDKKPHRRLMLKIKSLGIAGNVYN